MTALSAFGQGAGHWQCDPHDYQYDMSVYATVRVANATVDPQQVELAAFVGSECRGVAEALALPNGATIYSLRVRSNQAQGERVTFKVYDGAEEIAVAASDGVTFASSALVGQPSSPLLLSDGDTAVLPGDANEDGTVSVTDITAIVNYIMEVEQAQFNFAAADVNGDGSVSVSDITDVVTIIMNQ